MRILVTGSSGFIGQNLVEELLKEKHHVIGIDKKPQTEPFYKTGNYLNLQTDINNIESYSHYLSNIDRIYHLAASADMLKTSLRIDEDLDFNDNIRGTYSILKFMRKHQIEDLIFASSSSIYGNAKEVPTPENVSCPKPLSIYGASKLSSEALIFSFCNNFPIRSWLFRFSNVTGNRKRHGVVYDTLNKLSENKEKLSVLGDGTNIRSYIDVQDVIAALITIPEMQPLPKKSENASSSYNIGNNDTLTVKQVIDIICDELSLNPKITYTNSSWIGDLSKCIIDSTKAYQTGWKPTYNSEECIRREVRSRMGVTVL